MIRIAAMFAAVAMFFALCGTASAQDVQATHASRAADAIVSASTPAISGELARQLAARFQTIDDVTPDQQERLRTFLTTLPPIVQAAMEQRWTPLPPRSLSPDAEAFLQRSLDRSVAGQRGEIGTSRPPIRDVIAAALAERLPPEHLEAIANFLSSPAGRDMSAHLVVSMIDREADAPEFSVEHNAAISAFASTPAGVAYMGSTRWVTGLVAEQARLNVMTHGREIMAEVLGGICEIVPEQCAS